MRKFLPRPWQKYRLRRSELFDGDWYWRTYPDVCKTGMDPAHHYYYFGAAEGRDPGPDFSTTGYQMCYDIKRQNPVLFHEKHGRGRGYKTRPAFDGSLAICTDKRSVIFVAHQANPKVFGAERSLLSTLDQAIKAGIQPWLVLPRIYEGEYLDALLSRCCKIYSVPFGWRRNGQNPSDKTINHMIAILQKSNAVALYQNSLVLDAPLIAARRVKIPAIVHVHELPANDEDLCQILNTTAKALQKAIHQQADHFVAPSSLVADWLDVDPADVTIVPNSIDTRLFDLPFNSAPIPRIGLISSNIAKKGITDFIEVARIFALKGGKAQFLLIGPMSDDLSRLKPFPENVSHVDYTASSLAAIKRVDVVMSLSKVTESFGLTVYEAMAAGRPVVCYDRGTPPALVGKSGAGLIVAKDDFLAASEALADILSSERQLQKYSGLARQQGRALHQRFTSQQNKFFTEKLLKFTAPLPPQGVDL